MFAGPFLFLGRIAALARWSLLLQTE